MLRSLVSVIWVRLFRLGRDVLMPSSFRLLLGTFTACLILSACESGSEPAFREISVAELEDKIAGGWAGQMIGVSYGGPTEFRHRETIIPENALPE